MALTDRIRPLPHALCLHSSLDYSSLAFFIDYSSRQRWSLSHGLMQPSCRINSPTFVRPGLIVSLFRLVCGLQALHMKRYTMFWRVLRACEWEASAEDFHVHATGTGSTESAGAR